MKLTRKFTLERPARKAGGDRYAEEEHQGVQPMMGIAYVNQGVSRTGGIPAPTLWITVDTEQPSY